MYDSVIQKQIKHGQFCPVINQQRETSLRLRYESIFFYSLPLDYALEKSRAVVNDIITGNHFIEVRE